MKKTTKLLFLSTPLFLSAPILITSCSNSTFPDFSVLEKIVPQLGSRILPTITFSKNKDSISINDFDNKNEKYSLEWKENNISNKEELEEIKKLLNKVNIKFSHYLIPKIDKDNESNIYFEIELKENKNINTIASIEFNKIASFNNLTINKLTREEIKELIKTKIDYSFSLISDLNNIITSYFVENREYFSQEKNPQNQTYLNTLVYKIQKEITLKIKNFSIEDTYKNLYFINDKMNKPMLKIKDKNEKKYALSLLISTSDTKDPNLYYYYELEIPFYLEYEINDSFFK